MRTQVNDSTPVKPFHPEPNASTSAASRPSTRTQLSSCPQAKETSPALTEPLTAASSGSSCLPDKDGFFDALSINAPNQDALGQPLDHSHAWGYVLGDPVGGIFTLFSTEDGGNTWYRRVAIKRGLMGTGCNVDNFLAKNEEAVFAASNESLLTLNGSYLLFVSWQCCQDWLYKSFLSRRCSLPRIHSLS